jgi:hypothetical protein
MVGIWTPLDLLKYLKDIEYTANMKTTDPLYWQLTRLKGSQLVSISGKFLVDDGIDYFNEASLTEDGSMHQPELRFQLTQLDPIAIKQPEKKSTDSVSENTVNDLFSQQKPVEPVSETNMEVDEKKALMADWGNDTHAIILYRPCTIKSLKKEGYVYDMYVTIPASRLRNPNDAWVVKNDRALTVAGCWYELSESFIHSNMIRKKDKKITEEDITLDSSWVNTDGAELR